MTVSIYNTTDDPRKVDKSPYLIQGNISCSVFGECSLLSPVILLKYNPVVASANYMFIHDFDLWYFIKDVTLDSGMKMFLNTEIDPLYSYASQLKQCPATCIRNGGIGEPSYVPDSSFPLYQSAENFTSLNLGEIVSSTYDGRNWLLTTK